MVVVIAKFKCKVRLWRVEIPTKWNKVSMSGGCADTNAEMRLKLSEVARRRRLTGQLDAEFTSPLLLNNRTDSRAYPYQLEQPLPVGGKIYPMTAARSHLHWNSVWPCRPTLLWIMDMSMGKGKYEHYKIITLSRNGYL